MNIQRTRRRLPAVIGLSLLLTLLGVSAALGHAALDTVTPADKSTVQGSPTEIVMTFVQNLDPSKSSIKVADAAGKVVVQGGTVPAGNKREMDLAITTPLAPGAYEIRWTTFSTEDQEQARGTTTFTVAAAPSASPSPTPAATASPSAPASVAPSILPSAAPSASSPPTTPTASTNDAIIPVVVALIVLAALGVWLLRGRSRARS